MSVFEKIGSERYEELLESTGQLGTVTAHIERALSGRNLGSVLDVGAGTGLHVPTFNRLGATSITGIEPSAAMQAKLRKRIEDVGGCLITEQFESADVDGKDFDTAVFTLSLSWMSDPYYALERIAQANPRRIIITNQVVEDGYFEGRQNQAGLENQYKVIHTGALVQAMQQQGYYPLSIDMSENVAKNGEITTFVFTQSKPDTTIYDNADLIAQINDSCDRRCDGCYAALAGSSLDKDKYLAYISELAEGSTVALRGGEPTIRRDWHNSFVAPALDRGLKVIIDTNGWFVRKPNFAGILDKISNSHITLRISLDESHLAALDDQQRADELTNMYAFAVAVESRGITLTFSCLGMDEQEIANMLKDNPLSDHIAKFKPLTWYSDISQAQLKGKYLTVEGELSDRIVS